MRHNNSHAVERAGRRQKNGIAYESTMKQLRMAPVANRERKFVIIFVGMAAATSAACHLLLARHFEFKIKFHKYFQQPTIMDLLS